jgi:hypothetical protein
VTGRRDVQRKRRNARRRRTRSRPGGRMWRGYWARIGRDMEAAWFTVLLNEARLNAPRPRYEGKGWVD